MNGQSCWSSLLPWVDECEGCEGRASHIDPGDKSCPGRQPHHSPDGTRSGTHTPSAVSRDSFVRRSGHVLSRRQEHAEVRHVAFHLTKPSVPSGLARCRAVRTRGRLYLTRWRAIAVPTICSPTARSVATCGSARTADRIQPPTFRSGRAYRVPGRPPTGPSTPTGRSDDPRIDLTAWGR